MVVGWYENAPGIDFIAKFYVAWTYPTFVQYVRWRIVRVVAALWLDDEVFEPTADVDLTRMLVGLMLLRVRAVRLTLAHRIQDAVFNETGGHLGEVAKYTKRRMPAYDPVAGEDVDVDDVQTQTLSSLGDEVEAHLEIEAQREAGEIALGWPQIDLVNGIDSARLVGIHAACRRLEEVMGDIDEEGSGAGSAYADEMAARVRGEKDRLARLLISSTDFGVPGARQDLLPDTLGVRLDEQPGRGLFVHPGPQPTRSQLNDLVDTVVARYGVATSGSAEEREAEIRREAQSLEEIVRPQYDAQSLYAVWCWFRVAGRHECEKEVVVWTPRGDVFQIAEPMDVLGLKPTTVQLPDLKKLVRDLPRIARARARPFAALHTPADSGYVVGDDIEDTERAWGIEMICAYGIPVYTICALILFTIVFNILKIIPGFMWLPLLKFCIPVPGRR